jgi:hypothetical protein
VVVVVAEEAWEVAGEAVAEVAEEWVEELARRRRGLSP